MLTDFDRQGANVVKTGRKILGATNPADSEPGSIRGDLYVSHSFSLLCGSLTFSFLRCIEVGR